MTDDDRQSSGTGRTWARAAARRLHEWGDTSRDFFLFVAVVAAVIAAAVFLEAEDKAVLLKLFAVAYFSLLPAVLYLQFASRRKLTVWREYVLNLHQLEIDEPCCLPRPPTLSPFYPGWREARDQAWEVGRLHTQNGEPRSATEDRLEQTNLYRQKFRDLFGRIPKLDNEDVSLLSLKSAHKLQVVIATILISVGWLFVVQPETVYGRSFMPSDFQLVNLPPIPDESFAFAFLGAYFYILQMLVRRYFQGDLKSTAYINATMRIIIVILLVWVIDPLLAQNDVSEASRAAVAFVIGVFPNVGWRLLQLSIRKPIGWVVDSLEPNYKLGHIDGLNIWYESRLLEVGIEDMQNLATTNIVDVMLSTRIPVDRLVDWIDQAFLYLRVEDTKTEKRRALLRSYGVRNATDLLDLMSGSADDYAQLLSAEGEPSRMRALVATLSSEPNFQHVRAWKRNRYAGAPEQAREPEPEAPPVAAPAPA